MPRFGAITLPVWITALFLGAGFLMRDWDGDDLASSNADAFRRQGNEAESFLLYRHSNLGFSFRYPSRFIASTASYIDGESVRVQTLNSTEGFRVYITLFDRTGVISSVIIHEEAPDLEIYSPHAIVVSDIPALAFTSKDVSLGETSEVWFLKGGMLYQITGPIASAAVIDAAIRSWEFDDS